MSGNRRFPRAKWVLPDVIDPPERICFQIQVPNNRMHLAAFRGALLNLASAVNWQDDPDHTAKEVAKVWDKIYTEVRACEECDTNTGITLEDFMSQQIRISPDDSCIIQMWCIDHWEDWYDPRACIAEGASQGAPSGELETAECRDFNVTLRGNERYILPVPVAAGYTVQILDAAGGWWDGNILHAWNCPNGHTYALGACVSEGASDAGSPLPDQPIGRLIAQVGAAYYDAFNTTIVIPAGTASSDMYFQMNDDTLTDNQGSVSFTVRVCNAGVVEESLTFVGSDGTPVDTSFNTDETKLYKITVSGAIVIGLPYRGDAFYISDNDWATHVRGYDPSACGDYIELLIDSAPYAPTPAYQSSHTYVFYKQGTGAPFSFGYCDSNFADNSGDFNINVEEA